MNQTLIDFDAVDLFRVHTKNLISVKIKSWVKSHKNDAFSQGREASESEDDTEEIKDDPMTDTARNVQGCLDCGRVQMMLTNTTYTPQK